MPRCKSMPSENNAGSLTSARAHGTYTPAKPIRRAIISIRERMEASPWCKVARAHGSARHIAAARKLEKAYVDLNEEEGDSVQAGRSPAYLPRNRTQEAESSIRNLQSPMSPLLRIIPKKALLKEPPHARPHFLSGHHLRRCPARARLQRGGSPRRGRAHPAHPLHPPQFADPVIADGHRYRERPGHRPSPGGRPRHYPQKSIDTGPHARGG